MFSGICEDVGVVVSRAGGSITVKTVLGEIQEGDSLMVDGVCLTASKILPGRVSMDIGGESLSITALRRIRPGIRVNLERSLKLSSRIHGHFVYGHVTHIGRVKSLKKIANTRYVEIECPAGFTSMLLLKGSVALNGISLTVNNINGNIFSVALIPQTVEKSGLDRLKVSDPVNLEPDMLVAAAKEGAAREGGRHKSQTEKK